MEGEGREGMREGGRDEGREGRESRDNTSPTRKSWIRHCRSGYRPFMPLSVRPIRCA